MSVRVSVLEWILRTVKPLGESLLAVSIGLVIAGVIMGVSGYDPLKAYSAMLVGAVGTPYAITMTLSFATPLMLTGLTFAICARTGIFNIGAEGQVYVGAIAAVAVATSLSPQLQTPLVPLLAAGLAGAAWGIPAAVLKVTRGVHEVISTIMLNWIAWWTVNYLAFNPFIDPNRPEKSLSIPEASRLPILIPRTELSTALLLSVALAVASYYVMWHTVLGYEMRASGYSIFAASYGGINPKRSIVMAFVLGGIMSGIAGAEQVMGRPPSYAITSGLANLYGLGFDGIAVSLMGRNHPIGVILGAIFFGALMAGAKTMQIEAGVTLEMVKAVQGVIIMAIAVPGLLDMILRRVRRR